MDRTEAESILRDALRVSAEFEWSAVFFRSVAGIEEWPHYQRTVGRVMGELYLEIMKPIERAFPEFAPLIYEGGLFEESHFPAPPSTKQELAAHVTRFASAATECVRRSDLVLGVSAPEAVVAANHALDILGSAV